MPGKSKRKRPQYKNKPRQQTAQLNGAAGGTAAPAAVSAAAPAMASIKTIKGSTPKVAVYTPATKEQYPHFSSELKRIGVITVIILIILIVLAIVIK
jgi:hypothetical protein